MSFGSLTIEKPEVLLLILILIPVLVFTFLRNKKITKNMRNVFWRCVLRSFAWILAVMAFSEISWGTKKIPVHKSGSNVNFVFDISYSMLAQDGPQKTSRLDCVKAYVSGLLQELKYSSFSATLAKGDGFVAIPETEDVALMENMLENLSPNLMTSAGSSLGKGIEAALTSIPHPSSNMQYIWVFTDGDETDNLLEKALEKASQYDVAVSIVGFGSENESEITAGDGKTKVKTALRSKKLSALSSVTYVDSKSQGSAWKLLNQIKSSADENEKTLSYEILSVNHHSLFILLSILCLIFSFVVEEFKINNIKKSLALLSLTVIFPLFFMTSCSSEKKQILEGVWSWYEEEYAGATADFLNVANRSPLGSLSHEYAVFDLSATYFSLGEIDASLDRLFDMNLNDDNLPKDLRSAAFYNIGLIYTRKNDFSTAAEYFKKSILADSRNLNAKINLELCERNLTQKQAQAGEAEMQGVNEEKSNDINENNEIFNLIRENEGKKWRNMSDGEEKQNDVIDY